MERLRILYVDDEADIREVAVMALELDSGFDVRSCASGAEAIEVAANWQPTLILLDVMMPVMDGPATLARLRDAPATADAKVAFITARAHPQEMQHYLDLGAIGVIPKPFDPMSLAETVRGFL